MSTVHTPFTKIHRAQALSIPKPLTNIIWPKTCPTFRLNVVDPSKFQSRSQEKLLKAMLMHRSHKKDAPSSE